jgi:hypothetical protein
MSFALVGAAEAANTASRISERSGGSGEHGDPVVGALAMVHACIRAFRRSYRGVLRTLRTFHRRR